MTISRVEAEKTVEGRWAIKTWEKVKDILSNEQGWAVLVEAAGELGRERAEMAAREMERLLSEKRELAKSAVACMKDRSTHEDRMRIRREISSEITDERWEFCVECGNVKVPVDEGDICEDCRKE